MIFKRLSDVCVLIAKLMSMSSVVLLNCCLKTNLLFIELDIIPQAVHFIV